MSRKWHFALGTIAAITCCWVIAHYVPMAVFNSKPATGGDMGSHFWPVVVLHDWGLPHWTARPWNPGNLGGEGLLVHYFPLPFILMATAGYVIPLATAFNLGTILPLVLLPLSVWWSLRRLDIQFPAAELSAAFVLTVLLNEGHVMWGGNGLSTIAGQFAHMYALNFFFLATGELVREIRSSKPPLVSAFLFAATALSHAYLFIGMPIAMVGISLFLPAITLRHRILTCIGSGITAFLLASWYLVPMITNSPWTTPHTFNWTFNDIANELVPKVIEPLAISLIVLLCGFLLALPKKNHVATLRNAMVWLFPALSYIGMYFVFRIMHLVDVRAVPQVQIFAAAGVGILAGSLMERLRPYVREIAAFIVIGLLCKWTMIHVEKFPAWANWNYSGWEIKPRWGDFASMANFLRGNLSQPRIAFEHDVGKNHVGTERIFEMLPYFSGRASTESLYLQSTVLAQPMFYLQAELSQKPSCPYQGTPCPKANILKAENHLRMLGVGQIILSNNDNVAAAKASSYLKYEGSFGVWSVFGLRPHTSLVSVIDTPVKSVPFEGWRTSFWNWFETSQSGDAPIITAERGIEIPESLTGLRPSVTIVDSCNPSLEADFGGLSLTTDCPGRLHVLRYAYAPSFRASTGDKLFLVSPGMIGVIPSTKTVRLNFGASLHWKVFCVISFLTLIGLVTIFVRPGLRTWAVAIIRRFQILEVGWALPFGLLSNPIIIRLREILPELPGLIYRAHHRTLGGVLMGGTLVCYSIVARQSDSPFFWEWREIRLPGISVKSVAQGYGVLKKNQGLNGERLLIAGKPIENSLTTHANSEIRVAIGGQGKSFAGICGYPDYVQGAHIQCEVRDGEKVLFVSKILGNEARSDGFDIALLDRKQLVLVVKSTNKGINSAHAVWGNLRVQ